MPSRKLSDSEYKILRDDADVHILETIKGMSLDEMRLFDYFSALNERHYRVEQRGWILEGRYFLATRIGKDPDEVTLIHDLQKNHLFERFRAFYMLKYSDRIRINVNDGVLRDLEGKIRALNLLEVLEQPLLKLFQNGSNPSNPC